MVVFPAIDIMGGTPVRLYKGEFQSAKKVANNVLETAKSFEAAGASWVHMVDLDGSRERQRVNSAYILSVVNETNLSVEVGGGIRTMADIEYYIKNGVKRVILGSVAVKDPALVKEAALEYGEKIAVGIDAKNGFVAAEGWCETTEINFIDLAKKMEAAGVKNIIYTDISRDGTLTSPNFAELKQINSAVGCAVTASGGVKCLDDIKRLKELGLYGVICGKSIYEGTLSLKEAIEECL